MRVIDTHTEGEPTRIIVDGWPLLESRDPAEIRAEIGESWDHLRSGVVCEPRGHEAMVGALLTRPVSEGAAAGVIFFNNVGFLGMCGHGVMGVIRALEYLGKVSLGEIRLDTPVGPVTADLQEDGCVTVRNRPARCYRQGVRLEVPGVGALVGDIGYGGNWFYMTRIPDLALDVANLDDLVAASKRILEALRQEGIRGSDGAVIDHVEFSEEDEGKGVDARNFVLCPGGAYDRSPCGTGTSAKLASLRAKGVLAPGQVWRQKSVTGGIFDAWFEESNEGLTPFIMGRAWVTADSKLLFDPADPFRGGLSKG